MDFQSIALYIGMLINYTVFQKKNPKSGHNTMHLRYIWPMSGVSLLSDRSERSFTGLSDLTLCGKLQICMRGTCSAFELMRRALPVLCLCSKYSNAVPKQFTIGS